MELKKILGNINHNIRVEKILFKSNNNFGIRWNIMLIVLNIPVLHNYKKIILQNQLQSILQNKKYHIKVCPSKVI
jgi:hypothetical protein